MNKQGYLYCQRIIKTMMVLLFLVHGGAYAECHFGQYGEGGASTIVNGTSSSPVYFKELNNDASSMREIGTVYNAALSPELWSRCDAGNEGEGMDNITYGTFGVNNDGYALWPTNITGIYYAVRVYSDNNTGAWFTQSPAWSSLGVSASNESNDWKIQIKLYQSQEFFGNLNGATKITPQASTRIGGMSIGGHTDSDNQPWYFDVTTASFSIPISAATCQVFTVNDGTNNVDFGEVMFSSVREGFYPRRPFNLQFNGCNNVAAVKLKISANKTTSTDNSRLGNTLTSNAATGVSIELNKMFSTNPINGLVINDGAFAYVAFDSNYEIGPSASRELQFYAYLNRDYSQPLKAGNFKGIATFTVNYF
jgi:type 1 fimbria pilin